MLSNRQKQILLDFYHSNEELLTAQYLSNKYGVSVRTIQYDIAEIKDFIEKKEFLYFVSTPSKGSRLIVHDAELFKQCLFEIDKSLKIQSLNSRKERVNRIIAFLLSSKKSISIQHMADRLYVSKSTFMIDLKTVKSILKNYEIGIITKRNNGISIFGDETSIRECIMKENIDMTYTYNEFMRIGQLSESMPIIGDLLVNLLTEHKYRISNVALQNLIVHVDTIIHRIKAGFALDNTQEEELGNDFEKEILISKSIFGECNKLFGIPIIHLEIRRLAVYLKGKSDYQESNYITQEIDDFVLNSLNNMKQKFGIDLAGDVQLRISLALHIIPLLTRLKYKMQLKNDLLAVIRKSYQLAFDMAYLFSYQLREEYGYQLNEDEVAYFAIYFNNALDNYHQSKGMNKILIISSLKRSETLLLRERIKFWLAGAISELNIVNTYDIDDVCLTDYNVICTTEKNIYYSNGIAILISQFPSEEDCHNIMLAMDGFSGKEDILSLFKESRMFIGKAKDKNNIIKQLCNYIIHEGLEDQNLSEEVLLREAMGGTYYGSFIAMPHPMHPVTKKTQIAIALLENEIVWDDNNHKVRIVLLISIEKNNPRAYKLWSYLSEFITNENFVNSVLDELSYSNFIKQLSIGLSSMNY